MPLIDQVKTICARLAPLGWRDLLLAVSGRQLDIASASPAALSASLLRIDRRVPGFEDFALDGQRAIEAGQPSRSLLYHAFASPGVSQNGAGQTLGGFPTAAEIETIENYVFGVATPSLQDIRQRGGMGNPLAIVVFAYEYRPAPETVHRRQADLCFSRTGVARVGTAPAEYDPAKRGFTPVVSGKPNQIRVLPARYAAFLAVQLPGNRDTFGPMRFHSGGESDDDGAHAKKSDKQRLFWVPLHKLFSGNECLVGVNLEVSLVAHHVNEKLRRVHKEFNRLGIDGGWHEPEISQAPFLFTNGLAEFETAANLGQGLLMPVVHPALVEKAVRGDVPTTYKVQPKGTTSVGTGSRKELVPSTLFSSLQLRTGGNPNVRLAPEYVHARHRVLSSGQTRDLNDSADPEALIQAGGFRAQHYVDFTADGWIEVRCLQLATLVPRRIAAYSLVAAPDFFPDCDQRDLLDWTENSVPKALRENLWSSAPETLCDDRLPPNIQLEGSGFREEDETPTAIVAFQSAGSAPQASLRVTPTTRHSWLSDAAAGIFAPGWDVARTMVLPDGPIHLATFGLGSPFPEDAKLCAALSTFWPTVAPDAARQFEPQYRTVAPLTDEETGQVGSLPWDGIPGPRMVGVGGQRRVEYNNIAHADYVQNALDRKFTLSLTSKVDTTEYERRVLHMARVYRAMGEAGLPDPLDGWSLFPFRQVANTDGDLAQAAKQASQPSPLPSGPVYRFHLYQPGAISSVPQKPHLVRVRILDEVFFFAGELFLLIKHGNKDWKPA
jgi:hypothetical protein